MTNNKGPDDYRRQRKLPLQYWYILKWRKPIRAPVMKADRLLNHRYKRCVRTTYVQRNNKTIMISTIFLCLDHNLSPGGEPLLFETITHDGNEWGEINRCSTWCEALAQHWAVVKYIKSVRLNEK